MDSRARPVVAPAGCDFDLGAGRIVMDSKAAVAKNIYFIGPGVGTDAGGWYIGPDGKIHKVPGWNPEATLELARAIAVLRDGARLKTPGLAEASTKAVMQFVQRELAGYVQEGGVVVLG
jgi:hypothetical protein